MTTGITLAARPSAITFIPEKTALIVIDMQRDFIEPGGFGAALGNDVTLLRRAIKPVQEALSVARALGLLIIHTREATEDTFQLLKDEGAGLRVVFHCFTGGLGLAETAIDMGR